MEKGMKVKTINYTINGKWALKGRKVMKLYIRKIQIETRGSQKKT